MRALLPVAMLGLITTALATPAEAQGENQLQVVAQGSSILNPQVLTPEGRLPRNVVLQVEYKFSVVAPPLTICPFQPITIHFTLGGLPPFAAGGLAVDSIGFFIDQQNNLLTPTEYGPFSTTAFVAVDDSAPSGAVLNLAVAAQASPGSGTLGGCNLAPSIVVTQTRAISVD